MKTAGVLVCCLLVFPPVGAVSPTVRDSGTYRLPISKTVSAQRLFLEDLLNQGRSLFRSGSLSAAQERFEHLFQSASDLQEYSLAARGKGNVGACQFALHRYREAARSFLEAHQLAERAGDLSVAAIFEANLASLYSEIGELDSAVEWTERSLARLMGNDRSEHLASLQIQLASLRARQGRVGESMELFRHGIGTADRNRDVRLYAMAWNRLGEELARRRQYAEAEAAFLEAFRVRSLNHLPLDGSYTNLARVRLQAGDFAAAERLLDSVLKQAKTPDGIPARDVYRLRGEVRLREGKPGAALEDLRIALRLERAWRWSTPSDDAARIGAEGLLADVHGLLIEAGNRLYVQTGDEALIRETFEAAEENRANSLRRVISNRQEGQNLPPSYWEAISRLQRAELAALRGGAGATEAANAARADLVRMEAEHAPDMAPVSTNLLGRVQAALDADTAMLSFHLGEAVSWLWAVDKAGILLYPLPGRAEIQKQVAAAVDSIRGNKGAGRDVGASLYRTLFGRLEPRFQQKRQWLLALDTDLFQAPFPALAYDSNGCKEYLIERHSIQVIPGAGAWLDARRRNVGQVSDLPLQSTSMARTGQVGNLPHVETSLFVGIADPIYNTADPRLPMRRRGFRERLFGLPSAPDPVLMLPRLVGSGSEIEACARVWDGASVLLRGSEASRAKLIEQLQRNPAVVHFATHFLESSDAASSAMIPLGIGEVVPAPEISRWKIHAGVVVLSGCHSAAGAALRGSGLLGLTRAWLSAGARSVIATRWATPDEDGALFHALYRGLRSRSNLDSADALRSAQLEMIRGGGWRAAPRYWGAYFVTGME